MSGIDSPTSARTCVESVGCTVCRGQAIAIITHPFTPVVKILNDLLQICQIFMSSFGEVPEGSRRLPRGIRGVSDEFLGISR